MKDESGDSQDELACSATLKFSMIPPSQSIMGLQSVRGIVMVYYVSKIQSNSKCLKIILLIVCKGIETKQLMAATSSQDSLSIKKMTNEAMNKVNQVTLTYFLVYDGFRGMGVCATLVNRQIHVTLLTSDISFQFSHLG